MVTVAPPRCQKAGTKSITPTASSPGTPGQSGKPSKPAPAWQGALPAFPVPAKGILGAPGHGAPGRVREVVSVGSGSGQLLRRSLRRPRPLRAASVPIWKKTGSGIGCTASFTTP